ncbi:hypothetical protein ACFWYW_56780 [Nonomuraea sp. NPDC059023]|uniref:hypothetical protein n=1 Tax=unclassified Nonomuraea TaxID=2593643 RepID=UPI0036A4E240
MSDLAAGPVPYRITVALDYHGLYGPEVDIALGGVEPMVDDWEAGTLVPTREQIELLAKLTQFPVKFFYLPEPEPLGPVWLCRRSGPKADRCQHIEPKRPAPPAAAPAPAVRSRTAVWRCLVTGCSDRGRRHLAVSRQAAAAEFDAHYLDFHHRPTV